MTIFNGVARLNGSGALSCSTIFLRGAFVGFSGAGSLACAVKLSKLSASVAFAGAGSLTASATSNHILINFAGSGSVSCFARIVLKASVSFIGAENLSWQPVTVWPAIASFSAISAFSSDAKLGLKSVATLSGQGAFIAVPAPQAIAAIFTASGALTVNAFKPIKHLSVRFAGSGDMRVVTVSPTLIASAVFVGNGSLVPNPNATAAVLSTASSLHYSFPTIPNPNDPFMRRPSKGYNNYSASVRFIGAGRITAIAS